MARTTDGDWEMVALLVLDPPPRLETLKHARAFVVKMITGDQP